MPINFLPELRGVEAMAEDINRRSFKYLPLSVHIETSGGIATPLVLRGTALPVKRSQTFSTALRDV